MHVIGLDLGGTKLASALFDADGAMLHKQVTPLEGRGGAGVGELIVDRLNACLSLGKPVSAAGISVPGIYFSDSGRVWVPNIEGWSDYPLLDEVRSALEGREVRVVIDNDRACYILGETWKGQTRGCSDAIYLSVGTGIGAGILTGGTILRGAGDIAGSVGWMALDRPYSPLYDPCGCFEYHASGEGIAKVARSYLDELAYPSGELASMDPDTITAADLFRAYENGDPVAERVIGESVEYWGMAVANLISIFNPQKLIFGGGVFGPATRLIGEIRSEAEQWAQPVSFTQVEILASELGGEAGLIGAARLALMQTGDTSHSNR